jgi:squalene cyclase
MGLGTDTDLGGWCSSHLEVTATAGRAFAAVAGMSAAEMLAEGMPAPGVSATGSSVAGPSVGELSANEAAEAAWRYVSSRQREDGSWASYWWTAPHYPTLQAVGLAAEMGDKAAVGRAADWVESEQDEDGGWSAPGAAIASAHGPVTHGATSARDEATSAFATALSLSVLLRAGRSGPEFDRGLERLLALQEADGGWPSHPIMRIPPPDVAEPEDHGSWLANALGTGVVVGDQHRMFTTATCVGALGLALRATA